jgi:hypothetical protein
VASNTSLLNGRSASVVDVVVLVDDVVLLVVVLVVDVAGA